MCFIDEEIVYYKNITTKRDRKILRKIYLKRVEELENGKPCPEIMKDYNQFYKKDIKE